MELKYLKNISTLKLDKKKCTGCGMCIEVCPHDVFKLIGNKAIIIDKDACMECGACKLNCPVYAIEVNSGVGCASAIYKSLITGSEPTCGCIDKKNTGCC